LLFFRFWSFFGRLSSNLDISLCGFSRLAWMWRLFAAAGFFPKSETDTLRKET
jgi:hypothetical protein